MARKRLAGCGSATALLCLLLVACASASPLTLTWDNPVPDTATFVEVHRKAERCADAGLLFTLLDTTPIPTTTYVDTTPVEGTLYCYRVRAGNPAGFSAFSNAAEKPLPGIPAAPSNLIVSGGAVMAVVRDAVANDRNASSNTSIPNFTLTIGAIANGAVAIALEFSNKNVTGVTVTVGGVSASLISGTDSGSNGNAYRTMIFGLATGSTTGAQTVSVSWTGNSVAGAGAVSASGVDQTTPFQNGTFAVAAAGPAATLTVTSAVNNLTLANVSDEAGATVTTPLQTEEWNDRIQFALGTAGSRGAGAATVIHGWTTTTSAWQMSGVDIVAVSAQAVVPVLMRQYRARGD